ncbi:cell division protein FtsQ/DivIB [Lentibacillus amyloliquefaciens]|uniref:Cell division protein DivIB n=1 Tax=Lentibacillus amyloliquefaciens TaxID=1472767 RepID=A0A0U4E295_9BACI|nr:cell division protein FtsQ/DivIB [Lentibacillus amyloliquefaciens]ALX47388.1 cell division protein FtsQ [Lentibacillus amyloliquefaciens]
MGKKNVVSIEDRIPKLKQERKKKANRRLIFYLSIFFLLISIIVYLQSPLSYVRTIDVSGNSFVKDEEIIEASSIGEKTNIWSVNASEISRAVNDNPVIQQSDVNRKLPWTIEISVSEFDHVGYMKQDEHYFPVLGDGNVLENLQQSSVDGNAPLLLGFSDEKYLNQLTGELKKLPESVLQLISEIHWNPSDENQHKILLYMNDGYMVDGTIRDLAEKMRVYPSIVSQLGSESKGIIHIGAGVYFEEFNAESEEDSDNQESTNEHEQ